MGSEGEDILKSSSLSKLYDVVTKRLEEYFVRRRNTIYEHARFNQRRQQPEESVDSFITALYTLAEHCGYANLHDEMIRGRIVVGLRDARLSEKLQLEADLKLYDAIKQVWNNETIKSQQSTVRTGMSASIPAYSSSLVDALRSAPQRRQDRGHQMQGQKSDQPAPTQLTTWLICNSVCNTTKRSARSSFCSSHMWKFWKGRPSTSQCPA